MAAPEAQRWARQLVPRLRSAEVPLVQAAAAAGVAWLIARDVLGHPQGIFAPIGALLVLSHAPGRPSRRVAETALGAVLGVAVGDLLIAAIGTGPVQVAAVSGLAMGAAIALGARPGVVTQAGVASVLIATVQPPEGIYSALASQRLVDVLVGGGVGLATSLVLPVNPLRSARAAAAPFFAEFGGTLDQLANALDARDPGTAENGLDRARTLDGYVRDLHHALELAQETARLSPIHRGKRAAVDRQARAVTYLELAARDTRVLARAVLRATELEPEIPPPLPLAVRDLTAGVGHLWTELHDGHGGAEATGDVLRAARRATLVISDGGSMPVGAVVAQVRSTATDLLQALGLEQADAIDRVRRAADPSA